MPVVDSDRPQEPATVEALNSPVPGTYHLPFKLRSWLTYVDGKFRYTRLDGSISIVAACEQVNDYVFNPATFANAKYPFTLACWQTMAIAISSRSVLRTGCRSWLLRG